MYTSLQKAIRNNINLYEAIFKSHGLKFHSTNEFWYSLDTAPRLYSNLITLSEEWLPGEILQKVDAAYENRPRKEWTIKDSFANLDLGKYGFVQLFKAQWIYRGTTRLTSRIRQTPLVYKTVQDEAELAAWKQAWGSYEEPGEEIFLPGLLNLPNVKFIGGYHQGQILSGCLINKSEDVFGISNFFSPSEDPGYWSDLLHFITVEIENIAVVGYERNDAVDNLRSLGFQPIGNLVVWVKSKSQG